ncbi:hypothetical protein HPB47_013412 [Ixodes persulcatus]|uniref:Uncharacterized protein n=1 Tax=Ixodes persulcatus TaxID=34615 RepID=A0AC60QYJ8_IXOPE|nr:hypothetical protein HPB47_013412 [Ixodes persulcatus]
MEKFIILNLNYGYRPHGPYRRPPPLNNVLHNGGYGAAEFHAVSKPTYQLGDVFVSLDPEETQQMIGRAKEQNKARAAVLEEETRTIKGIMAELKSQLYNKFGNNINLEPDDS